MIIAGHKVEIADATDPIYNGFDVCGTYQINDARIELRQNDDLIYRFERALMGVVMEMTLRGFLVDMEERERAIIELGNKRTATWTNLSNIISAIGCNFTEKLPNSGKQLQHLFYDIMNLTPIKKTVMGETKFPMDRATLEKLEISDKFASPIINGILNHRDLGKSLQVLETEIDNDWRWRCSYNIAGTKTGRFSSSKSPFMVYNETDQAWRQTGCVLPSTEALTPNGWKQVSKLISGDLIAQWNKGVIEFKPCLAINKGNFSGELFRVSGEQIKQTLTPNHRVLYRNATMKYTLTEQASEVAKLNQEVIPLSGNYVGGQLEIPRFAAMLMADFSKEHSTWRATFKKQRKIDRFLSIATEFNLDFDEKPAPEGCRRFVIRNLEGHFPKEWGNWILDLTPECAEDLLEEARYWDATDRGSGFIFFTKDKNQADWFATLAHLSGKSATKRLVQQNKGSYSNTPIWWVNIKARNHARIMKKLWSKIQYEGEVFCPTVPSSYWLMREDGFISITGNSNFQNISEILRRVFIPDPGYKLYGIDKAQSEARDVGWFLGTILGDWTYLDAAESGDLHTSVTRLLYPEWNWTGNLKKDREIAERRFYRFFTYRDASKRLAHASNYLGEPFEISRQTRIPLRLVQDFQDRYFDAFPIREMHQTIIAFLQTERYLINSYGRRRDFFDRPTDRETWKSAVAYMFQSATADAVNLGLYRLWKNQGTEVQILSQLHDAVYFQYPDGVSQNEEFDMLEKAVNNIQITQRHKSGRTMTIPGEVVGGFNWAHKYRLLADGTKEMWNPNGLDGIRLQ